MRHKKDYSPGRFGNSVHPEIDRASWLEKNRNPAPDEKMGTSWKLRKPVYHRKCKARVGNLLLAGISLYDGMFPVLKFPHLRFHFHFRARCLRLGACLSL